MNVFVDLDGVLADFDTGKQLLFGDESFSSDFYRKAIMWKIIEEQHPSFYLDLPVISDAHILWEYLRPHNPIILTAIPSRIHLPRSTTDKRIWTHKNFGDDVEVRFGPFSIDKQFHCKPGDVLIDDKLLNIEQWINRGGCGILHVSAEDSIRQFSNYLTMRSSISN